MADEQNPWMSDYGEIELVTPDKDESATHFASVLQKRGVTAMVIVRRVREEYALNIAEAWDVLRCAVGSDGPALIREVSLIEGLRKYPDDNALARKVAKILAMSDEEARTLLSAYRRSTA